jgi:hypothetical protein
MVKKICLISDLHISVNPRLWKEAFVYEQMGYEVVVITQWVSDYFLEKDIELLKGHSIAYKAYLDMRPGKAPAGRRFYYRARRRLGSELQKHFRISRPWAVSYAPDLLFKRAIEEKADLYSAHVEAGFLAGIQLIKAGKKVGFDMEDWYSRDYLTSDRAVDLLHQAEGFALSQGLFFCTTSESMANRLRQAWNVSREITIIYNSFPDEATALTTHGVETFSQHSFKILWTSRSIGRGRGIETLVEALAYVSRPVELFLIGKLTPGYESELHEKWPKNSMHHLHLVEFVPHKELSAMIPAFDLGLAIENNIPDNKDLTISNKILQYMQAGIMVLCTETTGQMEVARMFPSDVLPVPVNQPKVWAEQVEWAMDLKLKHDAAKQKKIYESIFSWPVQEEKIRHLIRTHCPLAERTAKVS